MVLLQKHISWLMLSLFLLVSGGPGQNPHMIASLFFGNQFKLERNCSNQKQRLTSSNKDENQSPQQKHSQTESNSGYCTNVPVYILTGYSFCLTGDVTPVFHQTAYQERSLELFLNPSAPPPKV